MLRICDCTMEYVTTVLDLRLKWKNKNIKKSRIKSIDNFRFEVQFKLTIDVYCNDLKSADPPLVVTLHKRITKPIHKYQTKMYFSFISYSCTPLVVNQTDNRLNKSILKTIHWTNAHNVTNFNIILYGAVRCRGEKMRGGETIRIIG